MLAAAAACAGALVAAVPAAETPEHVTLIGDSVPTAIEWNEEPLSILQRGYDLDMEIAVCRRLVDVSCPFEGARPPTLLDLVHELGPRLGRTVVVVAGYNEPEESFPDAVEESLAALEAAGVSRILWVSLSERRADYTRMNAVLVGAAGRHPDMQIVPWGEASHEHDDWFQTDGVHLTFAGAVGMATMLHDALDGSLPLGGREDAAPPLTISPGTLPPAGLGRRYAVEIGASGGTAPYRWSCTRLPATLHFSAGGRLTGVPRRPGRVVFTVQVVDSAGRREDRSYALKVGSAVSATVAR